MMKTTVFLVDDHDYLRRGLRDLLDRQPQIEVVGEAATVAQALERIPEAKPDVAVLDVRLSDGDGIDLCAALAERAPDTRCLILTSFATDELVADAVVAGAAGFVMKDSPPSTLLEAVRRVASGGSLFDLAVTKNLIQRANDRSEPIADLSVREEHVLERLGRGRTNREIATDLGLPEKTVKTYVSGVLGKLGLTRRTQAAPLVERRKRGESGPAS